MKLSKAFAKLTCMKSNAVRILAAAALTGGILTAAAPAAQAQHFGVAVQFGGPRYYAPAPPPRYGYYDPYRDGYRYDHYRGHEDWRFHHEYERYHR